MNVNGKGRRKQVAMRTALGLIYVLLQTMVVTAAEDSSPKQWAILIGVEAYSKANPLQYTVNDVKVLANTLIKYGGVPRDQILEITDQRSEAAFQPRKDTLLQSLPEWLSKPGEHDTIIVYFSGHGFRDKDGKLYLAPLECDPDDPTSTGIPVEWFRGELASCKAAVKLLILDACHAGSEKGEESRSVNANDLGNQFEEVDRVVTIASSKASEKSQIWESKEQSLFSYWLNQGLKGHADRDRNGTVDIEELYKFVFGNVKRTADMRFPRPQSPVRIVRSGIEGTPDVVVLQPQPLNVVLADIAEQLASAIEERKVGRVGVLTFHDHTPGGNEGIGTNFGNIGKYCSEELHTQLQDAGAGKFSLIDRRRLNEAIAKNDFRIASLGSAGSLKNLSRDVDGMPVLVVGSLVSRKGRVIHLECKLQQTESDTDTGVVVGGSAALNESQWAMLGISSVVRPEDRRPEYREDSVIQDSVESQVIERVDNRAQAPRSHPFQDPTFEFNVEMLIDGKVRKGEFRGNDYFVPVKKGEVYTLRITSRADQPMMMRLLVDGLNTLPEKEKNKGIVTEEWGAHVDLSEARAWVLDPNGPELKGGPAVWEVPGFATTIGTNGKIRQFLISDADNSLAARQKYTDEIGLITAAFYFAGEGSRGGGGALGTQAGDEVSMDLSERPGLRIGNLRGVVHLRYVDADELDATNR